MPRSSKTEITFHNNPKLPTIKPDWPGNLMTGKRFMNGTVTQDGTVTEQENSHFGIMLKWMLSRNPREEEKLADNYRPAVSPERGYLDTDEDVIVWLGHASFSIRLNGTCILTDPCFRDFPGMKRNVPVPLPSRNCPPWTTS